MFNHCFPLVWTILFCLNSLSVFAQPNGPPGPVATPIVIAPDEKSIENEPASTANQINCWVSRSGNSAIAVSVYIDDLKLYAKLRRYEKQEEEYEDLQTQIKINATTITPPMKIVPVSLQPETDPKYPENTYRMLFTPPDNSTPLEIGSIRFVRGNKTRMSSKVVIRLLSDKVVGVPIQPCDQPPIDDIGEEEEIRRSTSPALGTNAPGASLPLIIVGS